MSFRTASAILRGKWLIDKSYADHVMPLVMQMMKGESVDFGFDEKSEEVIPKMVLSGKAASVYQVYPSSDLSKLPSGSIAMLDMIGPVTKYGDFCAYGSVDYATILSRLADAPNIEGIILNIDSPGGEVGGTSMLANTVKSISSRKPVVGLIDDGIAASAMMWIASGCNEIYTTQKLDQVGSIGVYCTVIDYYGYLKNEGLNVKDVYAPQSVDKNLDYKEAVSGNDDPLKEDLGAIADEFISTVAANRAGKLTSNDWKTGKMFYSKEATKIGLIDGQKSFSQVVNRMNKLISTKKTDNTMAFEKTLVAAGATSFELVDEVGFGLSETQMNSIENTLVGNETTIAGLNTEKENLSAEVVAEKAASKKAGDDLAAANTRIQQLETENADLKKLPAGGFSNTTKPGSDQIPGATTKTGKEKYETSTDREVKEYRQALNA